MLLQSINPSAFKLPGDEEMNILRSLTADAPLADVVDADVEADSDSIDENFLLAKSNAILMAKYLQRCSTSARDVVLMNLNQEIVNED